MKENNRVETLGLAATMGPFGFANSSSRTVMLASHKSQAITPEHTDIPRDMTGLETQLGEFAFDIRMPTDGIVIAVHHKYRNGIGINGIKYNPIVTVIYQCQATGQYDSIDVYEYHTTHKVYGIRYIIQPIVRTLREGMPISKGTILAANPNVKAGGIYASGVETNIAYISIPCTIEDGVGVTRSYLEKIKPLEINKYECNWGKHSYPLNVHGDDTHFKPFLNIGDVVPPSGLLFATREYDAVFDAFDMTPAALRKVDMVHDTRVYGTPGAVVYDVTVVSGINESRAKQRVPSGMSEQADRYIALAGIYYSGIVDTYDAIIKNDRNAVIGVSLHRLIVNAISDKPNGYVHKTKSKENGIIRRTVKRVPIDEYQVTVKCAVRKDIGLGTKLTGDHGNKAVIVAIIEDADAVTDVDGNVADLVTFAKGAISRLNAGQFYQQYINAASRDISKYVRNHIDKLPMKELWELVMRYYQTVSRPQYERMVEHYTTDELKYEHIRSIADSGVYLYINPTDENINPSILRRIEKVVVPTYDRVQYTNTVGERITTKDKVFIGVANMIVLEKTEQNPTAVSSSTLQHHGLLSGPSRSARLRHPSKVNSIRVLGETEVRLYSASMGGKITNELLDMANNPTVHRAVVDSILKADKPFNIDNVVDRVQYPVGNSRALSFVEHLFACCGYEMVD